MTYQQEILNCSAFAINGETIWFAKDNELFSYHNLTPTSEVIVDRGIQSILLHNDKLWLLDNINRQILSPNDLIAKKLNLNLDDLRVLDIVGDLLQFYVRGANKITGIYDLTAQLERFRSGDFKGRVYEHEILLRLEKGIVTRFAIDGSELWSFDSVFYDKMSTPSTSSTRYLGASGKSLYFIISSGTVIEVNESDGTVTKEWKPFKSSNDPNLQRAALLAREQIIVGFDDLVFWAINLKSGNMKRTNTGQLLQSHKITRCWNTLVAGSGGVVYFVSDQSSYSSTMMNHKLVAFNTMTQEIVDHWELPETPGMRRGLNISGPVVSQTFVCIYEQDKTLHIFKV